MIETVEQLLRGQSSPERGTLWSVARVQFIVQARAQYEVERVEAQEPGAVALRRSASLLRRYLSYDQKRDLDSRGAIEVQGSAGGEYTITRFECDCSSCCENDTNVGVFVTARYRGSLCIAAHGPGQDLFESWSTLPWPDQILAFKMAIEVDEPGFLTIADKPGRSG